MYSKSIYFIVSSSGILMILVLIWLIKRITKLSEEHYYDYLTKLRNSRRFYLDLSKPFKNNESLTICILDLDYFKKINDTYGHLIGDEVLSQVSNIFHSFESESICFYRIGGEEFACVIYPNSKQAPQFLMEKIRRAIEELSIQVTDETSISVTISIGMTRLTLGMEILEAINEADQALYIAKETGRNRIIMTQNREEIKDHV